MNVYKKGRKKKGLAPLPNIKAQEWAKKLREDKYKKKYLEDEKKKEERE